jgi:hypothetical protein
MEQPRQKKAWATPDLIALIRRKPEEAVLAGCKVAGPGGGNASTDNNCHFDSISCSWCTNSASS